MVLVLLLNLLAFFLIKSPKTYSLIKLNEYDYNDRLTEMSRLLNEAMNKVGKLSCQLTQDEVSGNGGWCSKISGKNSSEHMTDTHLAKALSNFLLGKNELTIPTMVHRLLK